MTDQAVDRETLEAVKISCLAEGLQLTERAHQVLSERGKAPLSVYEYPTTAGVTLELPEGVFVNAPFDSEAPFRPRAILDADADAELVVHLDDVVVPVVRHLPLPGYLAVRDHRGRLVTDTAMSHGDRVRLSPIVGCAYDCSFCDLAASAPDLRPGEQLVAALEIAVSDRALPVRHALISGGSPRKSMYEAFEEACVEVTTASTIPIDIMLSPMVRNLEFLDRTVAAGVSGLSINIEAHSDEAQLAFLPMKARTTRAGFEEFLTRAVSLLGEPGQVRSLIISGLEPISETLAAVEWLSRLGVTPVLSPFRPGRGTQLSRRAPQPPSELLTLLEEARSIVRHFGLPLGPVCLPCQHNTLAFPWDTEWQ